MEVLLGGPVRGGRRPQRTYQARQFTPCTFILRGRRCAVPEFKFWSHACFTKLFSNSGIWKGEEHGENVRWMREHLKPSYFFRKFPTLLGFTENSILILDLDMTNILSQEELYCYYTNTTFLTSNFKEKLKKGH